MTVVYILIAVAAVIALFLITVAMQPGEFTVKRSASMAASPAAVFPHVNDFHKWVAWSPWEHLDPNMKKTYEGPAAGVGSSYAWSGNGKAGEGKMTLVESTPHDLIRLKLEFIKPFACTNDVNFTFTPEGSNTLVNWTMTGRNNFMGKAFCMFMNMDKMVGADFEKGLASIKKIVETRA